MGNLRPKDKVKVKDNFVCNINDCSKNEACRNGILIVASISYDRTYHIECDFISGYGCIFKESELVKVNSGKNVIVGDIITHG